MVGLGVWGGRQGGGLKLKATGMRALDMRCRVCV